MIDPRRGRARALLIAAGVAALVGSLFPYVTLRIGFGPNVSLFATLVGFVALSAVGVRGRHPLMAVQAAGVAAGQTAFLCVALVAMDRLRARGLIELDPSPPVVFAWLATAGALGVLIALPLRRHFLDEERLGFAGAVAAVEAMDALESGDPRRGRDFGGAAVVGAIVARLAGPVSPLGVGSGMLIGTRVACSMGAGAALVLLVPAATTAWIACALLVSGGATRAIVRAPALGRALRAERGRRRGRRWGLVLAAAIACVAALCAIDRAALATPIGATLVAVALAIPLALIGIRVLGETNWAPLSALALVAQAVLALVAPGGVAINMIGSAVAAAIPNAAQHAMQNFRGARLVGAPTRDVLAAQLIGVVAGAAALAWTYPVIAARFGCDGDGLGLASPLGVAWANLAVAFTHGLAITDGAAIALASAVGVALALVESRTPRAPSAVGLGIGLLMPWRIALSVTIGGLLERVGNDAGRPRRAVMAAGLVAGEAVTATSVAVIRGAIA